MELARVTNLKPNLEARSTSNEDYQGSDPEQNSKVLVESSTEQALRLNQVFKPEQDSKVLVESSTEQALRLNQVFKPELDTKVLVDLLVEQQRGLQNSSINTNYLKDLKLNETRIHQEPNTPEENHQVPKPELNFKALVEQMAAAALPRTSETPTMENSTD